MEVVEGDAAGPVSSQQQLLTCKPHNQGPSATGMHRRTHSTRSLLIAASQNSKLQTRRTADDRRQASLRMVSTRRADPAFAAAAAAVLGHEMASHKQHHLANNHQAWSTAETHTAITISADEASGCQQPTTGCAAHSNSPFASLSGQSKTAAAVMDDAGYAVAGGSKAEPMAAAASAVVPAGWPATGQSLEG